MAKADGGKDEEPSSPVIDAREWWESVTFIWRTSVLPILQQVALWPMIVHLVVAVLITWIAGNMSWNLPFVCSWIVAYLWKVDVIQKEKEKRILRHELLRDLHLEILESDAESTKWLNAIVDKAWTLWMERFVSQRMAPKIAPWFLDRYKPWALSKVLLKKVDMGSHAPVITSAKVYREVADDDHLMMDMGVIVDGGPKMFMEMVAYVGNAWSGLGLVPWTTYATDLHLEGQMRMKIKFQPQFPFVERMTVAFVEQPKVKLAVRVGGMGMVQGFDAASLPLVAGYVDSTLASALKNSLVAPNMLVIDDIKGLVMEVLGDDLKAAPADPLAAPSAKLDASQTIKKLARGGSWRPSMQRGSNHIPTQPMATVTVEVLEGKELIAMDKNGFSDPFVKGALGRQRFQTSIQKATLSPSWREVFQADLFLWTDHLMLKVKDYDQWSKADKLGHVEVDLAKFHDGQRHEMWLTLEDVRSGQLKIAVTITDVPAKDQPQEPGLLSPDAPHPQPLLNRQPSHERNSSRTLQVPQMEMDASMDAGSVGNGSASKRDAAMESPNTLKRRMVRTDSRPTRICPGISIYAWDEVGQQPIPENA